MKKTLLTFSVFLAVVFCTLALAANSKGHWMSVATATPTTTSSDEEIPNYGVSIGTVEAQVYSESGLNLAYFGNADYVAQTSENTYMGFEARYDWVYDEETDDEIEQFMYLALVAINSTDETVTIPDAIKVGETVYPVTRINGDYQLMSGFNSNIKILTIPSTVNYVYMGYNNFDHNLDAIYMLGTAPEVEGGFQSNIYICNRSNFASYLNNESFSSSTILPYGWDFEWITVNVEKAGEFAEAYLTQNDYDWRAAQYLKVTGNINDIDLTAMKNIAALIKLDLSETAITSLPDRFMYNRSSLIEVKTPTTLKNMGDYAFNGCSALQAFDLNGITMIGSGVFSGCHSLSYINLTGVQSIGTSAFSDCSNLNNIDLSSVVNIGNSAFYGCSKLNNVDLSTVVNIGASAFYGCSSLESIDLTSAVSIGDPGNDGYYSRGGAFEDCTSLKDVTFGNNLQTLYGESFQNTAIENITFPSSLTLIPNNVFSGCKNLISVEIPSSITTIGGGAFRGCSSLRSITMETGLSEIASSAFEGCVSLEEVTIPSTVKSIGQGAFDNSGIKTFKCYAAVPPAAESSFIGNNMDMSRTYLYVPPFSKDFYRNTEYWSNFYLMRSIEDQIDYILVDRPLTINLEEEDNAVVANNPTIDLQYGGTYRDQNYNTQYYIGQLTATGEGTLSAGQLTVSGQLSSRSYGSGQYMPTLINYADKMRADNVTHNLTFYNNSGSGEWHFISLPYDVKVSDIIPSDNTYWVIRRYDSSARAAGETSETWVNLTEDDTLEAGKGYIVSACSDDSDNNGYSINNGYSNNPTLSFTSGNSLTKNNLFRSTDIIVPLTEYTAEFAHNRSWNLIGNPYPCYFDMHYLNEEFTAPITVWDGRTYVAYSPVDDDLVLSPYEAFFVQCPLDATEMTFKEAGRMHSNEGKTLYKAASRSREAISAEDRNVFNFVLSAENYEDRTRIVLNADAKSEYEIGRDASKFFADSDENAQIYVNADVKYSINERPVNDGIATLGIRSAKENVYTLALNGRFSDEWSVMLTDNETGITIDLTKESYQFTSAATENSSRFSVKFMLTDNERSGLDSIVADFGEDRNVTVTAADGVVVYNGRLSDMNVPVAGLYVISDGEKSHKAILK